MPPPFDGPNPVFDILRSLSMLVHCETASLMALAAYFFLRGRGALSSGGRHHMWDGVHT